MIGFLMISGGMELISSEIWVYFFQNRCLKVLHLSVASGVFAICHTWRHVIAKKSSV